MSKDENKDQTYFLWTLKKELFPSILFPIGHLEKSQVRSIAKDNNLPVATKKDSQGLCFVGTIDVKTLLKNYIDEKEGSVLNEEGEVIGSHIGVMFYTLGERHGFTITKKSTEDAPYFIVAKDLQNNTITVSRTPPPPFAPWPLPRTFFLGDVFLRLVKQVGLSISLTHT